MVEAERLNFGRSRKIEVVGWRSLERKRRLATMFNYFPALPTARAWEERIFRHSFQHWQDIVNEYKARKWWMMRGRITYSMPDGKLETTLFGHTREMETMLKGLPAGAYVRRIDFFGGFGFFSQQGGPIHGQSKSSA